jgi:hypothetical protein
MQFFENQFRCFRVTACGHVAICVFTRGEGIRRIFVNFLCEREISTLLKKVTIISQTHKCEQLN